MVATGAEQLPDWRRPVSLPPGRYFLSGVGQCRGSRFRGTRRVWTALVAVVVATGGLLALDVAAAGGRRVDHELRDRSPRSASGPNLNCSANHTGDTAGEFFGDTSCGTWTIVDGTLYGPALQTGSRADGVHAGEPDRPDRHRHQRRPVQDRDRGRRRHHRHPHHPDRHVHHRASSRSAPTSRSPTPRARRSTVRVYRAADCYLQNSDSGLRRARHRHRRRRVHDRPRRRAAASSSGSRSRAGSHAYEAHYSHGVRPDHDATCRSTTRATAPRTRTTAPASAGTRPSPASANRTFSSLITFSPLGVLPLSLSITPDARSSPSGGTAGYTVTVHNPNAGVGHPLVAVGRHPRDVHLRRRLHHRAHHGQPHHRQRQHAHLGRSARRARLR